MDQKKRISQRRSHHLRVPVLREEREAIERQAKKAGLSMAHYLREVGQGYQMGSRMDYEQVHILVRLNGDLGRLGGLLKLWLSDEERTAHFGKDTLRALLRRIETTQDQMSHVMKSVVLPKAKL